MEKKDKGKGNGEKNQGAIDKKPHVYVRIAGPE